METFLRLEAVGDDHKRTLWEKLPQQRGDERLRGEAYISQ